MLRRPVEPGLSAWVESAAADQAGVPKRERQPLVVEARMNAARTIDFMRDTLYSGKVFRTLNVIDEANFGTSKRLLVAYSVEKLDSRFSCGLFGGLTPLPDSFASH
jgi:hypothetical protein